MRYIKTFLKVYFAICLNVLLFCFMLVNLGLSLDPYAPPEQNLAFLMLSLMPMWYWIWQYLTRNEEIKIWQIF
jgi:hypothetical protein